MLFRHLEPPADARSSQINTSRLVISAPVNDKRQGLSAPVLRGLRSNEFEADLSSAIKRLDGVD